VKTLFLKNKFRNTIVIGALDARVREFASSKCFNQEGNDGARKSDNFDGRSVTRRRRFTLIAGLFTRAHLVHPSAAVVHVTAVNKTGRQIVKGY